nr:hypothetical protein [Pedobacter endophyticus]
MAKYYAAEGEKVVVNYASSKEGADKVVAENESRGDIAIALQGDVSKSAEVVELFLTTTCQ